MLSNGCIGNHYRSNLQSYSVEVAHNADCLGPCVYGAGVDLDQTYAKGTLIQEWLVLVAGEYVAALRAES